MSARLEDQKNVYRLDSQDQAFLNGLIARINASAPPPLTVDSDALVRQRIAELGAILVETENYGYFKYGPQSKLRVTEADFGPVAQVINRKYDEANQALRPYIHNRINPVDRAIWSAWDIRIWNGQSQDGGLIKQDVLTNFANNVSIVGAAVVVAGVIYAGGAVIAGAGGAGGAGAAGATAAAEGGAAAGAGAGAAAGGSAVGSGTLAGQAGLLSGATSTTGGVLTAGSIAAPTLTTSQVVSGGGLIASLLGSAKDFGGAAVDQLSSAAVSGLKDELISQVLPNSLTPTSTPKSNSGQQVQVNLGQQQVDPLSPLRDVAPWAIGILILLSLI
jgi:hypothetical protein